MSLPAGCDLFFFFFFFFFGLHLTTWVKGPTLTLCPGPLNFSGRPWSYGRDVEKVECANHAVKCFRGRLEQLAKDFPSFRGRGRLTKSVIMKITHGARCAIRNHSKTNNITKLRNDLRAGPKHYLGYHKDCDPSWCSEAAKETPVSVNLHDLPPNLLFEIDRAGDRLVNKAAQLISNSTTNLSECYMSIRAKMDGGKQVNRIQSGSFQHRCMTAGLSMILGPGWHLEAPVWILLNYH